MDETTIRDARGRLRLPFSGLAILISMKKIEFSRKERPTLENTYEFLSTMTILATRLKDCISRFNEHSWTEVPFHQLFVDTQSVVLFLRQFMEDAAILIGKGVPHSVRAQLPSGFTKLADRITKSGPTNDQEIDRLFRPNSPLRRFLESESAWFMELKEIRDDVSHRSVYGRLRDASFPGLMELVRAGGGKAPFASGADLRTYLVGLFQRWFALGLLVGDFLKCRVIEDSGVPVQLALDGFIVSTSNRHDVAKEPVGTTIMSMPDEQLESLEYFLAIE